MTSPVAISKPVRRAAAAVYGLIDDRDVGFPFQLPENVPRAVGAVVVDKNDLLAYRHRLDASDDFAHPLALVVDGDHHGQLETFRNGVETELAAGRHAQKLLSECQPAFGRCRQLIDQRLDWALVIPTVEFQDGGHVWSTRARNVWTNQPAGQVMENGAKSVKASWTEAARLAYTAQSGPAETQRLRRPAP